MKIERRIIRSILWVALIGAICVPGYALWEQGVSSPIAWSTTTAAMAVIAATISSLASRRIVELHEDAFSPNLLTLFDLRSRYNLVQFKLVNKGGSPAFDIKVETDKPLKRQNGDIVQLAGGNTIPVLHPNELASVSLGSSQAFFEDIDDTTISGTIQFSDASGNKYRRSFKVSAEHERSSLVHNQEELRTHYDIQKIPGALKQIADVIREIGCRNEQS